jgi:hypothetical protein
MLGSALAQARINAQAAGPKKSKANGTLSVSSTISYQGYVADSTGAGINGTFPMTFGFFTTSTGGSAVLTQPVSSVTFVNGVFNVNLDVSSIAFTTQYWLETNVNGETLAPRAQLTNAPYALQADTANYSRYGTHHVGESYAGGIVFYVDALGEHGLIAAPSSGDETEYTWDNGSSITINAVRTGIGAGLNNTERIIAIQGAGNYAAQACANSQSADYGDWYLPSIYELYVLYLEQDIVGGFAAGTYWSSTESTSAGFVNTINFNNGAQGAYTKANYLYYRAIRAF